MVKSLAGITDPNDALTMVVPWSVAPVRLVDRVNVPGTLELLTRFPPRSSTVTSIWLALGFIGAFTNVAPGCTFHVSFAAGPVLMQKLLGVSTLVSAVAVAVIT